jgi:uncharacterized protein (TIGR03437 family)
MRYSLFARFGLLAIFLALPCRALSPTRTSCSVPAFTMFGAPVIIPIAVNDDSGIVPTGTVQVTDNGTVTGTSNVAPSGTAKITTAFSVGIHIVACSYSGDSRLSPSISSDSFVTTIQAQPTIVLTPSQNPVPAGQRVLIDVRVAGFTGGPVGAVTLRDGDSILAVLPLSPEQDSSRASFIGILPAGTHIITASYDGDLFFTPATTARPLALVIGKRPTSTVIRNATQSVGGFVFHIQVASDFGSPNGSVNLTEASRIGASTLGTETLNSAGQTTITVSGLTPGIHSIVANYSGDQDFATSSSTPSSVQVPGSAVTVELSAQTNPVQVGQNTTLSALVTSSSGVPDGTVTFQNGASTLGIVTLSLEGRALLRAKFSAAGTQTITASYSGSSQFAAAVSTPITITVIPRQLVITNSANFNTTVAPDSLVSIFGDNLAAAPVSAALLPWPPTLGGASVVFRDSTGIDRLAALKFVSPGQINAVVPADVPLGQVTVIVRSATADVQSGTATIANVAPGLFSGNGMGTGAAAAAVQTSRADGSTILQQAFSCDGHGNCTPLPINLGTDADQNTLILFGVGIRGGGPAVKVRIASQDLTPTYAGPQPQYGGVDQVNVPLPGSLRGTGDVPVMMVIGDQVSNTVVVHFQ